MKYCQNSQCPFPNCESHIKHAPRGFAVTTTDMDKTCQRLIQHQADEEAKRKRMEEMTLGTACMICMSIEREDVSVEEKGLAIWKMLHMETHNSITKAGLLNIIRFLMGLAYDLPEEDGK